MLDQLIKNISQRSLFLLLVAITIVVLMVIYAEWFKNPVKNYQQQREQLENLQLQPQARKQVKTKITKLREEITSLDLELSETGREVLKGTKAIQVIADLGNFAKKYKVRLLGISPAAAITSDRYIKTPFNIQLIGQYSQLFQWVYTLEHSNDPLFIEQLSVQPNSVEGSRKMTLIVNLIQPLEDD